MFINNLDTPVAQNTNASVSSDVAVGDHFDFLFGGDGNTGAFFGNFARVYVFDSPLIDDEFEKTQAESLFSSLRSVYGVA